MAKQDLEKEIENLKFENSVLQASVKGEHEPQRVLDETCPGCNEKLIAGKDPRTASCSNKDCKVMKVLL